MSNQIQNFLNYLLDTETTSEIVFIETIQKNHELFHSRYLKDWEQTVFSKLQQVHRTSILTILNSVDNEQKSENDDSEDESMTTTTDSSTEDDDEEEKENKDNTSTKNEQVNIKNMSLFLEFYR